ncbi:hypothetical protein M758_UG208100 [Ceratodon purpureus]|nr:hypothetical protein M758_UG208100 [Ceratodon purpureus]
MSSTNIYWSASPFHVYVAVGEDLADESRTEAAMLCNGASTDVETSVSVQEQCPITDEDAEDDGGQHTCSNTLSNLVSASEGNEVAEEILPRDEQEDDARLDRPKDSPEINLQFHGPLHPFEHADDIPEDVFFDLDVAEDAS